MDLDGVLVDAMDWHEEAFLAALRAHGGVDIGVQEHRERYAGMPTKAKLAHLVKLGVIPESKVERIAQAKQALTQTYIELHATIDAQRVYLLRHFQTAGYLLGCVTNCITSTTIDMLTRTGVMPFVASCVVTNEMVKEPKPSPEPYRKACGLLGVETHEALAFEDHDIGMTSAFNAGVYTRQITTFKELTVETVWTAIQQANLQEKMEPV